MGAGGEDFPHPERIGLERETVPLARIKMGICRMKWYVSLFQCILHPPFSEGLCVSMVFGISYMPIKRAHLSQAVIMNLPSARPADELSVAPVCYRSFSQLLQH